MAAPGDKWIFNRSQLSNTPSRKCGIDPDKELNYRQQTANFIQDMGQRLQVTQLCINTAIVYMHRFYMFHSFAKFNRHQLAAACLFLAAKVEEQPRKLEHVIKVAHMCQHKEAGLDTKSEAYLEQAQELVVNENILLQSLGFDITVDHPHTHVVKTCQLVRAAKDLAQTSYFLATNSLHLTSMCLQYHPTVVASVCIHLACKWSNWQIPRSSEGKEWFWYTDKTVTHEMLEELTREFLDILDKCPSKLKKKIMTWKSGKERDREELTYEPGKKQFQGYSLSKPSSSSTSSSASKAAASSSSTSRPLGHDRSDIKIPPKDVKLPTKDIKVPPSDIKPVPAAAAVARTSAGLDMTDPGMRRVKTEPSLQNATHPHTLTPREYMERKERDRLAAQAAAKTQVAGQNRAGEQRGADRHHLDALIAGHERNRPDSHREQGLHSGVKAEQGQAEHRHNRHAEHRHSRHGDPSRQYAEHAHHRDKMRDPNMPQRSHMDPHQQRPHASAAPNKEGSSRPQQGTVHRSHTDIMKIRDPISQSVQNIAQKQEGQLRMHGDPSHSKSSHRTHANLKSQTPHKPLELKSPTKPPDIKSPEIKTPPGLKSDKKLFLETMVKIEPLPPPEQLMAELSKPLKAEPESPTGTKLTMSLSALQNRYEVTRTPEKKPQSPLKRQSSEKPGPEQHAPIRVKLGDLKREKTRHSSTGTPPSEKKDLPKLKISFGGSPGVASVKREDASTSRSSPQSTGELKLKLDLKKSKSHESSPSKSRSTGVDEYKVTNPGNPPLKLKLNLSKMGMSPSTSSHKSSKHSSHHHHHHHHSSKNGSSHSSRKRPHSPQILSPQQQQQQQSSTSNPSKVARTHEHHQRLQQWNNAQTVAANGGNANMMRPEYGRTQSQEDISEAQLQLQQLIALQSAKMQQQFGDLLPTTNQQE